MSAINTSSNTGHSSCKVVDYATLLPNDAKCISLRIANSEVPVKNASDVLIWVCKKMTLHRTKQLQTSIRERKTSWIKTNGNGMGKPCRIAYNCFVDLDASGRTALLRASLILKWLSWPSNDAVITYERPSASAGKLVAMPTNKTVIASGLPIITAHSLDTIESEGSKSIAEATRVGTVPSAPANENVNRFSYKYDNVEAITGAEPISLIFKGKEYPLDGKWLNLPEKICMALETLWPCKLHDIVGRGNIPNMALNPTRFRKGKFVKGAGVWYEANCASREFVQQTRRLCKLFGIGLENVSITYTGLGQRPSGQNSNLPSAIAAEGYPNSSKIAISPKIGVYVKQQIYAALAEDRIPDADFDKLLTVEGTKELFGTTLSACPLFAYSPMIGPDGRGHNSWGDPAVRRGKRIFVNSQWYERHWDKARRLIARWNASQVKASHVACGGALPFVVTDASKCSPRESSHVAVISPAGLVPQMSHLTRLSAFAKDIRVEYSSGFDFRETSRRLVGERVGKRFGDAEADRLKEQMFQRADGLWLFPDMVISDDALRRMKERARGFLSEDGYFSMDALHAEFEAEMRNIDDGRDFDAFFAKFVAGDVRGVVRGHGEWRVCFAASMSEASGWETIVKRIREVLKNCGDAVPVEDIIAQMPSLVRGVVVRLAREQMEDAVVFDAGGVEYIKLLESYYLPADFSEVVSGFVETTEASQNVVSVVLLEAELDGRYGDGFRVNYGLEDDSVFKQVVAKSFTGKDHGWNRDMFTLNGRRGESNVAEVFMKGHRDKFHEEDFFRYALESRGMKNRGMLILTFLRKHCIRLSRDWWISTDSFEARFGMGDAQYHQVGIVLNEVVGNNRFVPISSLGEDVYDRFPRLECEGKEYPWNPYLLTSVAVHKVRNAKVVNDEPSPYTVTAMILPHTAEIIGDVVEYVLGTFPKGYFNDVDSAFRYLKMNNVRLTKTEKLVAKIKVILGIQ